MIIKLAWRNWRYRWWQHALSILLLILGIGLLLLVKESQRQAEAKLERNLAGIDLVIGAKGSPLQLILSAIYQLDAPTGNIPLKEAQRWANHPLIAEAVPLAYGDAAKGFRIVGCNYRYPEWYAAELAAGAYWKNNMEVVLGARVAESLQLKIGDQFDGNHGLDQGDEEEHGHYTVTGILKPNNSVIDQLILCSVGSVWAVHGHEGNHEAEGEISALLLKYKTPRAALMLPRTINENTLLQAAAPAIEINRVYFMLEGGSKSLSWIALALLGLSLISLFVQSWQGIQNRLDELALMRSFGLSKLKLVQLLAWENVWTALIGFLGAELMARLLLHFGGNWMGFGAAYRMEAWHFSNFDLYLAMACIAIAKFAVLAQARKLYRLDIPDLLLRDA
ncbi:MAG: ABC transporter permease [Bacteroidetes bacterium]|nr:MAG: ABC transporter permease [Bacteroidota bacterium]